MDTLEYTVALERFLFPCGIIYNLCRMALHQWFINSKSSQRKFTKDGTKYTSGSIYLLCR